MATRKEFEGLGGERLTVGEAHGGVIEFDDGSILLVLRVAGREDKKLIHPVVQSESEKALSFYRRFVQRMKNANDGEGYSDFEMSVFRAAHDFAMTEKEKKEWKNPDKSGIFSWLRR